MKHSMTLLEPIGLTSPSDAAGFVPRPAEDDIVRHLLRPQLPFDHEKLILAGFDAFTRLVAIECATADRSGRCVIPPRCWQALLGRRVAAVLMAHNHPSSIARPSDADLRSTREAVRFLGLAGIELIDHLIFVEDGHFSFRQARLL